MMLGWLLSVLCVPHAAASRPLELTSKDVSLIYAKTIDITVKKDGKREMQLSTFKITHVYCGDRKLKGETFLLPLKTVSEQQLEGGPKFALFTPWVKEGEEGVWWVCNEKPRDKRWQGKHAPLLFGEYPLPARKGIDDPKILKNAIAFANLVETIDQAAEGNKRGLLEKAVHTPDWEIAGWAIRVICRSDPDRLVRMVRDQLAKDPPNPDHLSRLIKQLDDDAFKRREAAMKELTTMGLDAVPALCEAMACSPSLETRRRITSALKKIDLNLRAHPGKHLAWTILQIISPSSSPEAAQIFRRLRDLAQKHSNSWLNFEMRILVELEREHRARDFGRFDHWNELAEIYWERRSEQKKHD